MQHTRASSLPIYPLICSFISGLTSLISSSRARCRVSCLNRSLRCSVSCSRRCAARSTSLKRSVTLRSLQAASTFRNAPEEEDEDDCGCDVMRGEPGAEVMALAKSCSLANWPAPILRRLCSCESISARLRARCWP